MRPDGSFFCGDRVYTFNIDSFTKHKVYFVGPLQFPKEKYELADDYDSGDDVSFK